MYHTDIESTFLSNPVFLCLLPQYIQYSVIICTQSLLQWIFQQLVICGYLCLI